MSCVTSHGSVTHQRGDEVALVILHHLDLLGLPQNVEHFVRVAVQDNVGLGRRLDLLQEGPETRQTLVIGGDKPSLPVAESDPTYYEKK